MRDEADEIYADEEDDASPGRLARLKQGVSIFVGAALAVAIIGGAGLWVWRLSERDITAVPVIRAALTPAKVRPEARAEADQTRITSYEAASGAALPERVRTLPPPPGPAEEDVPMGRLAATPTLPAGAAPVAGGADGPRAGEEKTVAAPAPAGAEDEVEEEEEPAAPATEEPSASTLVSIPVPRARPADLVERVEALRRREAERAEKARQERLARATPPTPAPPSPATPAPAPPTPSAAAPAPSSTPMRPASPAPATPATPTRPSAPPPSVPKDPELAARAAASAVQIQLGAFPSRAETEAAWARIYRTNEDVLRGRALVMQSTISSGRRFFRLRAGPFRDRVEAQQVCRALQARGQDCLVAVNG